MRKFLLLFILFSGVLTYSQESKLIASCCDGKEGRCTGSAYCSACSNCSRCAHCGAGGSCGVCATYTAPKTKTKKSTTTYNYIKSPSSYTEDEYINVTSETINVREGAGTEYKVVAKLKKGTLLQFLGYQGDWLLVKVPSTGKFGYVYYKYVNK